MTISKMYGTAVNSFCDFSIAETVFSAEFARHLCGAGSQQCGCVASKMTTIVNAF